jgi:ankyrin repeat protein
LLIDAGADQQIKDFNGRTALDFARTGNHKKIASILKAAGPKR